MALSYQLGKGPEEPGFGVGNFFSFFTVQSNLLAVVALAAAAIVPPSERSPWLEALRGAAVLYMAITGLVFALFLAGDQHHLHTDTLLVNFVVHRLLPVVMFVDWILDPPNLRLPRRVALAWLAYPLAYLGYTLIRGAAVDWYPYPFVDVSALGYGGVTLRCALLLVGMLAAAAAVDAIGNHRSRAVVAARLAH